MGRSPRWKLWISDLRELAFATVKKALGEEAGWAELLDQVDDRIYVGHASTLKSRDRKADDGAMRVRLPIALAISTALLLIGCGDDESTTTESTSAESGSVRDTLFVQSAGSGGFESKGSGSILVLRDVSELTTLFSERPERESSAIPTADFVEGFEQDFGDDPPNAAVSSIEQDRGEYTVELMNPSYDEQSRRLTYEVRGIGMDGKQLPASFGPASVFIDAFPTAVNSGGTDGSMAGRVVDKCGNGVQLADMVVTDPEDDSTLASTTTSLSGTYEIDDIVSKDVSITITREWFEPLTQDVDLSESGTTYQNFTMTLNSNACTDPEP